MNRIIPMVFLALGAAACAGSAADAPKPPPDHPTGYEVRADALPSVLPVAGTIAARHRAEISTRLMARVTEVPVDVGAVVRAGQALLRLGIADIAANRTKAQAAVAVAQAARDEAARHGARMDTLYAQDAVAAVQRDQARLGLTQAESELAVAQATLAEVETAAGYARIAAPFDGVVVARWVDPGDLAAPGQPLLVVERNGPRDAVLALPAEAAAGLEPGDTLSVRTASAEATGARIRAIAGGADPMTRTVEVRVEVPASWPTGVSVTGLVPTGHRMAVAIPATAVIRRGQLTGVRVITGDRTVLRWIRTGRTVGDRVEVLSGLEAGERIVP